ncbi:uncharacterized protein B0P05DRAFT_530233 [Gilbertella persicaria]|uniref:uncharacterized protein n=1 Tax=Gilbertella persicaria TaxID=101096 RepID=UPI00221E5F60|nr:uncharacterized protein B0P05DRAFT_530233 [Gilbertella persicaria]KAI8090304.1 hypothetical protein B0P05DRAFT_530233 [Gilbertella persicaria]
MLAVEDQNSTRIFACPQCPKIFATRSNLKRHMENPNIHNIPYVRSRDQKRWKGHSKKVVSKEETTESNNDRMRKWRAENREKNRQNDLRCRVYRLARQKFGEGDSIEKQGFVREEIARRLGRRMMLEKRESNHSWNNQQKPLMSTKELVELPFYSAPQQKIELPSIDQLTRAATWSSSPPDFSSSSSNSSSPVLPHLSPTLERRTSSSSISSTNSSVIMQQKQQESHRRSATPVPGSLLLFEEQELGEHKKDDDDKDNNNNNNNNDDEFRVLPSMHTFLSYASSSNHLFNNQQEQQQKRCISTKGGIKYVESNKILDEFVGVVLNYVDNATVAQ